MADEDNLLIGIINYWCREKHYTQMQQVTKDGQRRYTNDVLLKYFNAIAMLFEGRVQESMRELDSLCNKPDVNLCGTMALIHAHRQAQNIDKESVSLLDSKLKSERKSANAKALYFAGLFLIQTGRYDKAREYIDRSIKMDATSANAWAAKGWLELLVGDEASMKKSIKYFEESLSVGGVKSPDAYFGKMRYLFMRRSYVQALDVSSQAIVSFPNFLPGFIEKMKLQLALQDWDQTVDTAQRALEINSHCLRARLHIILQLLCRDGNYSEASNQLDNLIDDFANEEPKNAELMHEYARVICRVSGRNAAILERTHKLQSKAVSINSNDADYMAELAYEMLMAGKAKDAITCYRSTLKLDESSLTALTGMIHCQLLDNQVDEAASQLEFLSEVKDNIGTSAELIYLNALLCMKRNESSEKAISLLNKALDTHLIDLRGLPLSSEYFLALNPNFLTQVMSDYMSFAPQQPLGKSQAASPILERCLQVLEPLCKAVPGLLDGLYLMAKAKFLSGDIDGATGLLQRCLEQNKESSECHILMSQIYLHSNDFKAANQSLEMGLSYNFEVREHPVYHLIKSRILKKQGDLQEAVKTLQQAMQLPGVRLSENRSSGVGGKKKATVSVNDRVSLYIELADTLRMLNQQPEAAKVMQDAINSFKGTGEEVRITIANVDLALTRGDVDGALEMLRGIGPDDQYFIQAREKMADIYLNHRNDKRLYVGCYRELAEKYPSQQTHLLLGDAYLKIQEPDKAIEVYEAALRKNPKDAVLASKIGEALVRTHQFGKAINYYEAALKQGGQPFLRHDLAELLMRLKQYEKAEKVLLQAIDKDADGSLEMLSEQARYLALLSQVRELRGASDKKVEHLRKAKELADKVVARTAVEQPEALPGEKKFLSTLCCRIAQHDLADINIDAAIQNYREALSHAESDGKIMLELAKLYMTSDDLDSCQQLCSIMLREGKERDAASVLMADMMFRKDDFEQATSHFRQILHDKPDHYAGLARIIEVLRRAGKLDECERYLEMAEKSSGRATMEAGYNYCYGLYSRYIGKPNEALGYLNKARKDSEYGTNATYNMVEICLNPDNDTIGGVLFEAGSAAEEAADKAESERAALKTADMLLRELKPKIGDQRHKLLGNLLLISTKNRSSIEQAVEKLNEMSNTRSSVSVGVLYGLAVGYTLLKDQKKAVDTLNHISQLPWNMDEANYFESSWLLLADHYIQTSKDDAASELLDRCLQRNRSCAKAYEYLGYITERAQSHTQAAQNYELAWKHGGGGANSPAVGYKLAFNYLRAQKYVDAIDICHSVLKVHPTYPKMRQDILNKARLALRT